MALTPTLRLLEQLGIPYAFDNDYQYGPLWDSDGFHFDRYDQYGDQAHFHEFMHWMVAADWQKQYPDLSLGRHVNSAIDEHARRRTNQLWSGHGKYSSWGDEPRLHKSSAAGQELNATVAMGLYDFVFGKRYRAETFSIMYEFSAWGKSWASYVPRWTARRNMSVVEDAIEIGIVTQRQKQQAYAHLERWRMCDPQKELREELDDGFI